MKMLFKNGRQIRCALPRAQAIGGGALGRGNPGLSPGATYMSLLRSFSMAAIAAVIWVMAAAQAAAQTPLYFNVVQMTGATNDRVLNIRAVNNPNIWNGNLYWLPDGGTNIQSTNAIATVSLTPGPYVVSIVGLPLSWTMQVTNSLSQINALTLPNSLTYYSGVQTISPGAGVSVVQNPPGTFTVTDTNSVNAALAITNKAAYPVILTNGAGGIGQANLVFGGSDAGKNYVDGTYANPISLFPGMIGNTFVGYFSGENDAGFANSGNYNTALGYFAMNEIRGGNFNTAIGGSAFADSGGGTNNIAIGFQAGIGLNTGDSTNIDIGNGGVGGDDFVTRIGSAQTKAYIAGQIIGNGSGLTAVNAATATNASALGGVAASFRNNPFVTSWMTNTAIAEWWSADSIQATDQQQLFSWAGRGGNILTGNCTYVSQVPSLGHPGVYFDNSGNMIMTNNSLLGFNFTNSGTIVCVYSFPPSSYDGNRHVVFSGNTLHNTTGLEYFASLPNISGFEDSPPSLNLFIGGNSFSTQDSPSVSSGGDTFVYLFSWTPTNCATFYNGKIMQLFPNGGAVSDPGQNLGPNGFSTCISLGQIVNPSGFWPLNGYIEEFLVSSNSFSLQTDDTVNNYFMYKYGLAKDQIILCGDSLPSGAMATWNGGWASLLASNYPGWLIVNVGVGGGTTSDILTNILTIASSSTMPGRKIAVLWNALINDSAQGLGVITNAQNSAAQAFKTNGIPCILVIPPSSQAADTTFYNNGGTLGNLQLNVAYRLLYTNGWQNYYSAVVPLWEDPNIGYSNAWTSATYYGPIQDGKHLTNAGYAAGFPYLQSAINYVLNPANPTFTGTTNQPPPWGGPGWSLMYNGHLYNSLGAYNGTNYDWTLIK